MKLSTLKGYFLNRSEKTILYIVASGESEEFLLTAVAFHPREQGKTLLIDVGPYLVYSLTLATCLYSESTFRGLYLTENSRVTRRFNTHLRNVFKLGDPEQHPGLADYLKESRVFGQGTTTK